MTKIESANLERARQNMKIAVALSDMNASEISQKAGLSINVLNKYMRGETMISFGNMQAICDILNIPIALIASSKHISPERIKLVRAFDRMSETQLDAFLKSPQYQASLKD